MRVAILGANGYLGRHLTKALDEDGGYHLTLIDKSVMLDRPKSRHIVMQKDITCPEDREDMARALLECDVICYKMGLLGIPNLSDDIHHLGQFFEQNVNSFFELFQRCHALDSAFFERVKILVDSSVMRFGGVGDVLQVDEDSHAQLPTNFYGLSKHSLEAICDYLRAVFSANIHILRYTRVTSSKAKNVISIFVKKAQNNEDILLTGNVDKRLNFVHIEDVTSLSKSLILCDISGQVWHCGGADNLTLMQLAETVVDVAMSHSLIKVSVESSHMVQEVEQLYFSDAKTRRILGLTQARALRNIIEELL